MTSGAEPDNNKCWNSVWSRHSQVEETLSDLKAAPETREAKTAYRRHTVLSSKPLLFFSWKRMDLRRFQCVFLLRLYAVYWLPFKVNFKQHPRHQFHTSWDLIKNLRLFLHLLYFQCVDYGLTCIPSTQFTPGYPSRKKKKKNHKSRYQYTEFFASMSLSGGSQLEFQLRQDHC